MRDHRWENVLRAQQEEPHPLSNVASDKVSYSAPNATAHATAIPTTTIHAAVTAVAAAFAVGQLAIIAAAFGACCI